ncbi:HIT domain-containing protein [Planosporangium flavigriseum]|nr:HIT domain-containing protein [Planosporangium flavigriseum]
MNYQTLGNSVPHLHMHLLPRFVEDSAPGAPSRSCPKKTRSDTSPTSSSKSRQRPSGRSSSNRPPRTLICRPGKSDGATQLIPGGHSVSSAAMARSAGSTVAVWPETISRTQYPSGGPSDWMNHSPVVSPN